MSAMSDIAIELEMSWTPVAATPWSDPACWTRTLPDGTQALIMRHADGSHSLSVGVLEVWVGENLPDAVIAAGALAKAQLREMAALWT